MEMEWCTRLVLLSSVYSMPCCFLTLACFFITLWRFNKFSDWTEVAVALPNVAAIFYVFVRC